VATSFYASLFHAVFIVFFSQATDEQVKRKRCRFRYSKQQSKNSLLFCQCFQKRWSQI